jgi:apolipoprotein D and lipocalin family protein
MTRSSFFRLPALAALLGGTLALGACASKPPLPIMSSVDVSRYMGPWYVISATPTFMDPGTYGAVESYERGPDGRILTTYTYHKDSFDGPLKTMKPVGRVKEDGNGAVWTMQFVPLIQADYRIMYVDPDYQLTLVGQEARGYAWIMARKPQISEVEYARMIELLKKAGYDTTTMRRVPQATGTDHPPAS